MKTITMEHISTKEQLADMFTKPLPLAHFRKQIDVVALSPSIIQGVRE
jgi:hypothetical protein